MAIDETRPAPVERRYDLPDGSFVCITPDNMRRGKQMIQRAGEQVNLRNLIRYLNLTIQRDQPTRETCVYYYDGVQQRAIHEIHESSPAAGHAMVKVKLHREPDGSIRKGVNPHWTRGSLDKEPYKWLALPRLTAAALTRHVQTPDCIIGLIPAIFGIIVLDIDCKEEDALERVTEKHGQPVAIYPTLSGGWHALYHGRDLEDMKRVGAGAFFIDGKHYGEVCCARRFSNAWSPLVFKRAIDSWAPETPKLTSDAIDRGPVKQREEMTGGSDFKYTLREIVEGLELQHDPTRDEYIGFCPICTRRAGGEKQGGGTRFRVRRLQTGKIAFNCFVCAERGFNAADYGYIMDLLRSATACQRRAALSNLIGDTPQRVS